MIRCLTTGLPRDASVYEEARTFDEQAYQQYETAREKLVHLFEDAAVQYLRTPFVGNQEEVCFDDFDEFHFYFSFFAASIDQLYQ